MLMPCLFIYYIRVARKPKGLVFSEPRARLVKLCHADYGPHAAPRPPLSAPGANCVPGANTHLRQLLFRRFCRLENCFESFYNLLPVKVKILFFNLLKTRTKSESLFIFILELQRKKRAGARQNLREILLFQREFHN